ncbi:Transcriptional regulator for ferulate or vanillate catabolism [Marinobacterium lacunae]|uniref:Transcriptional regulator for ferulate or vanillate catabolism n=1 Tax=Marinobacterium lacunae TaxID=1232683 RepID=A0A081G1P0_9GAMM|nr:GntR family transcriptional regulator [Marinobacterium lacunae]KEA64695.1 Transcriptional regulator for ferulate or vanillate catabolism [Marinobacterium lacunae]MBR9883871.1 GntR family transcriptional regulator [Oceanospirillales bacterium]
MSKAGHRVLSTLRQMIISGELEAGERIAEIPTAERLGVSRTPVRIAFRALEQEGLLIKLERRGYRVREVTPDEVSGAIEVRGVLEGLAARQAAELGISAEQRKGLLECLAWGDQLFDKGYVTEEDLEAYHDLNRRFHALIIEASCNPAIGSAMIRNEHLPFASVSSLAIDRNNLKQEYRRFNFAHMQHHAVFDAIDRRQGARAEAIMREHANATLRYADLFAQHDKEESEVRVIGNAGNSDTMML